MVVAIGRVTASSAAWQASPSCERSPASIASRNSWNESLPSSPAARSSCSVATWVNSAPWKSCSRSPRVTKPSPSRSSIEKADSSDGLLRDTCEPSAAPKNSVYSISPEPLWSSESKSTSSCSTLRCGSARIPTANSSRESVPEPSASSCRKSRRSSSTFAGGVVHAIISSVTFLASPALANACSDSTTLPWPTIAREGRRWPTSVDCAARSH
mmetsp:Transcript_42904/g.100556  ORF Transcript_42904/g.100556 Transcript_42904/m.100556 type:complete len:213 (+) Transcript_42904:751-1389(+)